MAERLNVAVSKTVEGNTSGGSNPSLSAGNMINITQKPVKPSVYGLFDF
jgi:hypothetical protein